MFLDGAASTFVHLWDPLTGCLLSVGPMCETPGLKKSTDENCNDPTVILDVRIPYPRFEKNGIGLDQDIMPGTYRETKKFVRAFVQMACAIAVNLEAGKNVIVACKLGKSRSPNVVAAFFFLFRGYELEYLHEWLNINYRTHVTGGNPIRKDYYNSDQFFGVLDFLRRARENEGSTYSYVSDIVVQCDQKLESNLLSKLFPSEVTPVLPPNICQMAYNAARSSDLATIDDRFADKIHMLKRRKFWLSRLTASSFPNGPYKVSVA